MDLLFDTFQAWQALMFLFAGLASAGAGVLIAAYAVYVRASEQRYPGEIVAVRAEQAKQMYWPVVAYRDGEGRRREALANGGSSSIVGNIPRTKVTVFAGTSNPERVIIGRDWWVLLLTAALFIGCGAPFLYIGWGQLELNMRTLLVALALLGWAAYKLYPRLLPLFDPGKGVWQSAREKFAAWRAARQDLVELSDAQIAAARAAQTKQTAIASPIVLLIGLALLCGGLYWLQSQSAFAVSARSAEGVVIRNETRDDSDGGLMIHAVVAFTDSGSRRITYTDSVGSSIALYKPGDKVTILYDPQNSKRAMIDRGVWNWLLPTLIAALGALLAASGVYGLTGGQRAR